MKFYVAGSCSEIERVQEIQKVLIGRGHTITADWTGEVCLEYKPEDSPTLSEWASRDINGALQCDIYVGALSNPVDFGAAVEMGIVLGQGKTVWVIGDVESCIFMYSASVTVFPTLSDMLEAVDKLPTESEYNKAEVGYNGFATPCLVLEGSDKVDRGSIVDFYAKTNEQDGLLCGEWSKGTDKLIHIYLIKPVAAICDERVGWVAKQVLLDVPIDYMTECEAVSRQSSLPKKAPEIDVESGTVKW